MLFGKEEIFFDERLGLMWNESITAIILKESLVHNFGGVTTCISLVRKGKVLAEFRSFGGVAT